MNKERIQKMLDGFAKVPPKRVQVAEVAVALVQFVATFAAAYAKNGHTEEFVDSFARDVKMCLAVIQASQTSVQ